LIDFSKTGIDNKVIKPNFLDTFLLHYYVGVTYPKKVGISISGEIAYFLGLSEHKKDRAYLIQYDVD